MSRPPPRKYQAPGGKEPLDPWGEVAEEVAAEEESGAVSVARDNFLGLFSRLYHALFWRPISSLVYAVGGLYGSLCIYLFAHNQLLNTYGEKYQAFNIPDGELVIPPNTLIVTDEGIWLLLCWIILPPLWFLYERYVMFKSIQHRAIVRDVQELSIKVWLAFLFTMVMLAHR